MYVLLVANVIFYLAAGFDQFLGAASGNRSILCCGMQDGEIA